MSTGNLLVRPWTMLGEEPVLLVNEKGAVNLRSIMTEEFEVKFSTIESTAEAEMLRCRQVIGDIRVALLDQREGALLELRGIALNQVMYSNDLKSGG